MTTGESVLSVEVLHELRALDGDGATLLGLVQAFRTDGVAMLEALRDAIRLGQHLEVARLAHSLCGSARALGARHLANAAKELQLASRLSDADEDRRLVELIDRELGIAVEALEQLVSR